MLFPAVALASLSLTTGILTASAPAVTGPETEILTERWDSVLTLDAATGLALDENMQQEWVSMTVVEVQTGKILSETTLTPGHAGSPVQVPISVLPLRDRLGWN